ncbi:MAG TPA: carbohydrate ABC transporter permease, partial [Bacillota bacterium]|nr:carbohydrate ABC transporter permease [Bacillota bacterium]
MRDFIKINRKADIALNIVMILCTIACVLPLLIVFSASITDEKTVTMYGYSLFPRNLSLEAYKYIYKDIMVILRAYGVTVFVTVVGSALSLVTIALYAYPISRKDFKYRNVFTFIVFLTMLFNGGLVPWYMVYVNVLHIDDTIMALILPYLMTPLYVLIMRTFFMTTIPDGIIEAARIDGAGEFQTFVWIVLPLAKPVLATIGLFNILTYWNDWYAPLLFINNEKLFNLQYLMYRVDKAIIYLSNNAGSINNATQIMA